jgi:hypothetical protein
VTVHGHAVAKHEGEEPEPALERTRRFFGLCFLVLHLQCVAMAPLQLF